MSLTDQVLELLTAVSSAKPKGTVFNVFILGGSPSVTAKKMAMPNMGGTVNGDR